MNFTSPFGQKYMTFIFSLQNTMMDLNVILATSTYQLLNEQLTRSQSEVQHFRVVAEKLQVVHWLI